MPGGNCGQEYSGAGTASLPITLYSIVTEPALSFGQAASDYDRVRPTYPIEAVRWALDGRTGTVVDLGAGTGLLTRVITGLAERVIAVEPDAGMRARLEATTPSVTVLAGSAESIPLARGNADAVLAGQAYHWFDRPRAHAQIARVVRPGGIFAPIWNIRDENVPWIAALTGVIDTDRRTVGHRGHLDDPDFGAGFATVEHQTFRHAVAMDAAGLVGLVASRSYYLTATPRRQAEIDAAVREIAADLPAEFEMPYLTYCYRAARIER